MLLSEQDLLKVCGCSYVGVGGGMSQCVHVKHNHLILYLYIVNVL